MRLILTPFQLKPRFCHKTLLASGPVLGGQANYTEGELDAGQLDNRYFTEAEHLNTSAGAGDAGKPIKLDAGGKVDASMVNDGDIDHGSTGGLADDDHTQYHTDARGDARYVELAGSTMTGLLTLSGDPTADLHSATKQYVDATSAVLDSGTATSATSTTLTDTSKSWGTDIWTDNKISITGGTGSGQARSISSNTSDTLTVGSAWSTTPDATSTYNIVGGGVTDHGALTGLGDDDHTQYHNDTRGDARYLKLAGGTMTGKITLDADPTTALHAATKQYVDSASFLPLAGGTMTGKITLDADPTSALHAATKQYVDAAGGGKVVQIVHTQTGAVATGTTTVPDDDTIPQNTEGDEYMTLAITPTNSSNILYIEVIGNWNINAGSRAAVALFQDTTANALATNLINFVNVEPVVSSLRYRMVAGTTSATTFKVRAGGTSGTVTFNGNAGARKYGGVINSSITITEVTP